ncbi:hypothetical protein F4821DRAFT_269678 [Hypoxylon rubiginosum]|uniref:Uncharacterized protein n=1 Tax=Hypoxylon rubiginosum TaxID=110542 RepID=A0ACC0D2L0_9PEZI|nr:hypothetical protein F4821DRAFT_269678 [Hypoxylon rubiginosum]
MDRLSPYDARKPRRSSSSNRSSKSAHTSDSSDKGYSSGQRGDKLRPARKRASKPKVRTGCISCKRRHVKCDEGKPSCAECDRLGLMCEGYAPPKTKTPATRAERLLLPKPKLSSLVAASSSKTPAESSRPANYHPLLPSAPSFGFELNEEDKWYFSLYRDQIIHELSPYCQANFFSRTSLRDSMVNRCVHHSILSIGAYARALMDLHNEYPSGGKVSRTWWPPSVLNRHHQAALVHHAKALSHLRSSIREYGIDSRVTMAATLLFIVFENMQGNYHSSGNLIRSGIKVLTNIRNKGSDPRSILRRQWHRYLTEPRDEVDEMTNIFARHSAASAFIPFAHGKFAYHMLFTEDESEDDAELGIASSPFTFTIPQTLEQARQIWVYLIVQLADFLSKATWHNQHPEYDFDDATAFREQAVFLALLNDLGVGLDALLFTTIDSRQSQNLELLRLHHTVALIATSCALDPTEMMYDDYLPQFEEVVQRCRIFGDCFFPSSSMLPEVSSSSSSSAQKVGFTNEAARLPLLAFVGAKCRSPRVRADVVDLMRSSDWREGSWDSSSLAGAVEGLMKLEGQGQGPDDDLTPLPPSVPIREQRYAWSNMFWDFEKRQMHVEYTKVLPDVFGELETVRYVMGV